jgi:CBS domain containing-hemolysin-like protein
MSRIPQPVFDDRSGAISPVLHSKHASVAASSVSSSVADTRKKQSKKDEAIRRKIESELARKRTISTTHGSNTSRPKRSGKIASGTVAALKPSPALTVPESITVADASQLCAAKRTDCVLVVDEDEGLSGIFTAKDLAYRVSMLLLSYRC